MLPNQSLTGEQDQAIKFNQQLVNQSHSKNAVDKIKHRQRNTGS
jgi:hypothetical protein